MTQTVQVQGATPLVSTANASIGTVVSQQEITDLPLGAPPPLTNGAPTTTEMMFANPGAIESDSGATGQLMASLFYFTPTLYEWSFDVDSQLGQNWAVETGYTGNRGVYESTFGYITSAGTPRDIQFGLKFKF